MAGVRFTELQSRPLEFLDFTSLTLEEFQQFPLSVPSSLTFIATERSFGRLAIHGALRQVCPPLYRAR